MATFGARLREAREAVGLTQGELAVKCGWGDDPVEAQSRISNYERGKREPTLTDLRMLAKVLSIDPAELAFGHPLAPDEIEATIIRAYRTATPQGRIFILDACESAQPAQATTRRKRRNR